MSPYKLLPEYDIYFVTISIVEWVPVFISVPYFDIIVQNFQYCQIHKGLSIYGYVVTPTHVHAIISIRDKKNLSDAMRDFKSYTSKQITHQLRLDGKTWVLKIFSSHVKKVKNENNQYRVWQKNFHPKAIVNESMFLQKLEYIHANPVRKGFVSNPEDWSYSSAKNYFLDDEALLKIDRL